MVYSCIKYIRSIIYPSVCVLCERKSSLPVDLCADCLADLKGNSSRCSRCGLPLAHEQATNVCGACIKSPPPYLTTLSAFDYEQPVKQLISNLKFNNRIQLAKVLAHAWLQQFTGGDIDVPEAMVPVPLHRSRLQQRGYNQALELARPVARVLGIPLLTREVVRSRATLPQTDLTARQRRQNIRGSFQVCLQQPYGHVAIFDDVVTTGSTVRELAKTLKQAGVERVDVWCIARASR